jgi:hypothetical protein
MPSAVLTLLERSLLMTLLLTLRTGNTAESTLRLICGTAIALSEVSFLRCQNGWVQRQNRRPERNVGSL